MNSAYIRSQNDENVLWMCVREKWCVSEGNWGIIESVTSSSARVISQLRHLIVSSAWPIGEAYVMLDRLEGGFTEMCSHPKNGVYVFGSTYEWSFGLHQVTDGDGSHVDLVKFLA